MAVPDGAAPPLNTDKPVQESAQGAVLALADMPPGSSIVAPSGQPQDDAASTPAAPPAASADPVGDAVDSVLSGKHATTTQRAKDPADAALDEAVDKAWRQDDQLKRFTAYRATNTATPPDRQLEVLKYAAAADVDPSFADENLDELKKTVDLHVLAGKLQAAPGLAKFMADAAMAPLVKDDVANLTGIEWALGKRWEFAPLQLGPYLTLGVPSPEVGPAPARAFRDGLRQQDYINLANKEALGFALSEDEKTQLTGLERDYGGDRDYGAHNLLTKGLVGTSHMGPYLAGDVVAGAAGAAGGAAIAGGAAAETGPGAAVAAVPGAVAGAATGTFAWNFFQNFGPQYRGLRKLTDENGQPLLSESEARELAAASSVVGAGVMTVAGAGLLAKVPGVQKILGKVGFDAVSRAVTQQSVRRVIAMAPVKAGVTALSGGIAMAGQSMANAASVEAARGMHGGDTSGFMGRVTDAGWQAFVRGTEDMLPLIATGVGHEFLVDLGRAKQFEHDTLAFGAEADAASKSALLDRDPGKFEEFHRLAQGENPQARHIDVEAWNRYWQAKKVDPAEIATRVLGDDGAAYQEAASSGGALSIPAEKFMASFGKTEHIAGLRDDIRFSPDGVSLNEACERMADLAAKTKEAADVGAPEEDGAKAVAADMKKKGIAAGVEPKVADAVGSLWGAAFRNLGKATGVKADEAYRQLVDVRVNRGESLSAEPADEPMARAAQLAQADRPTVPGASTFLRDRLHGLDAAGRADDLYRDHATGLLNETALKDLPAPTGKKLALFEFGNVKAINDHPEHGGHEIADGAYRLVGSELAKLHDQVFKDGGRFAAYVKDDAEAQTIRNRVNKVLGDKDLALVHAAGDTKDEAVANINARKDQQRAKGQYPDRERPTPEFLARLPELKLPEGRAAPEMPKELIAAAGGLSHEEAFAKGYVEKDTDVLTARAWNLIPRKKVVASIDLRGLKKVNDQISKEFGDRFLEHFGKVATEMGGSEFDFAHRSGDEYLAQADSQEELSGFLDRLRGELKKNERILKTKDAAGEAVEVEVGYRHGLGESELAADRALNQQRADEKASPTRDSGAVRRRVGEGDQGEPGQARGDAERAPGAGGRPQAYPGPPEKEVTKLSQARRADEQKNILFQSKEGAIFRLEKDGDRGFVTFGPPEGGKPRRFNIHILENADPSTFAHETFHVLSEVMGDVATQAGAPGQLKSDYQTLLTFMGHATHEQRQEHAQERRQLAALGSERTPEQDKRLLALTAKEERATHAWEQYLTEGKSPSLELAGVFSRFRRWLTGIYRGISNISGDFERNFGEPLNLSDEVHGVFDRLVASEDEIHRAQDALDAATPFKPAFDAMTPAEQQEYARTTSEATTTAEDELRNRIAQAQRAENAKWMREEREKTQAQVETELDHDRTYRTIKVLQGGDELLGDMKLDRATAVRKFGADAVSALPRGIFAPKGEGKSPDEAAAVLGWNDAQEMVGALGQAQPRSQVVRDQVQQRMEERFGPSLLDNPQEMATQASVAVHNDQQFSKALLELRALRRALNPKAPVGDVLDLDSAKKLAEGFIPQKTVGELTAGDQGLAGKYLRNERTAAKRALDAAMAGRLDQAVAHKEQQILNMSLFRAATERRAELLKAEEKLDRAAADGWRAELGKADPSYRDASDAILQAIGKRASDPSQGRLGIEGFLAKAVADAQEIAFDSDGIRDLLASHKAWEGLTSDQAQNVSDAIANIRHAANAINEVTVGGKKMSRDAYFQELQASLQKHAEPVPPEPMSTTEAGRGPSRRAAHLLRGGDAILTDTENFAAMMDGGDHAGPATRLLVDARLEARAKELDLQNGVLEPIRKLWEAVPKGVKKLRDQVVDVDLPVPPGSEGRVAPTYTRDNLWMLFLRWGDEGNRQRIRDGNGWNDAQVERALSKLGPEETDFLQGVLDGIESLRPELAATYERRTGLPLGRVEASPITVNGKEYRGGYFPIKYDPRFSRPGAVQEADAVAQLFPQGYKTPYVASGHTKTRLQKVNAPVDLSWGNVPAHLAQVTHDIAYGDWVRQAGRLMLDQRWKDMTTQHLGPERAKEFVPWLRDVANARADSAAGAASAVVGEVSGIARSRLAIGLMGLNLPTLAVHMTDPLNAVAAGIRVDRVAAAYPKVMSEIVREWIPSLQSSAEGSSAPYGASAELAFRDAQHGGNLKKALVEMGPKGTGWQHVVNEVAFKLHELVDRFNSKTIFTAGYWEGKARGLSEEESVQYGDDMVRRSLPVGDVGDKARALRTKNGTLSTLMFYGYASKLWNIQRRGFMNGPIEGAAKLLWLGAVGAGSAYLAGRGPEEDESKLGWVTRHILLHPFSTIPWAGPAIEALVEGKPVDLRAAPELAYIQDTLNRLRAAAKKAEDGDETAAERVWGGIQAIAGGLGPVHQSAHTFGYAKKLSSGEAQPRGPFDVGSGLIYGQRPHQGANPLSTAQDLISQ